MTFATVLLTNKAYGYPNRGDARRVAPIALANLHVTANPNSPPATARQERDYANRAGSEGPSAHSYLNPDGSGIHAIDTMFAAWSNGILRSPKLAVPGMGGIAIFDASWNPNEAYVREIEHCGRYPEYPITPEQIEATAGLIAQDSLDWTLPIDRSTVHLHSDLDTEQRPNCPVPASMAEAFVAQVIDRANAIRLVLERTDMTVDELLALLSERFNEVRAERDDALAEAADLRAVLTEAGVTAERLRSALGSARAIIDSALAA